jgi:hypothetical protein
MMHLIIIDGIGVIFINYSANIELFIVFNLSV